jgi:hypothetical protein
MKKHSRRDFLKSGAIAGSLLMIPGALSQLSASNLNTTKPPGIPDSDDLMETLGFINVTSAPFFADPTGKTDTTKAIQDAVNEARNTQKVCFFPSGTYLISDTISCEQRVQKLDKPRYTDDMRQSWWEIGSDRFYILGSTIGEGPVLKLSKDAIGFDNPAAPKFAMKVWAQTRNDNIGTDEPVWGNEQPNISFGHILRGLNFDISGHAGAIGVRHAGSQGTLMMDCSVKAEGALAGFNDCPGQGGGTYNISTYGGKYGLIIDASYRFPMLAACTFKGQSIAPVVYTSGSLPLMMVGCYLESNGDCAFDITRLGEIPGISLVDCMIKLNKPGSVISQSRNQNIFMENVYIQGATHMQNDQVEVPKPKKWTHVLRYSSCSDNSETIVNGVKSKESFLDWETAVTEPSQIAIVSKHWKRLPSFEDADAVNIKSFGALGDGKTDDSEAFKKAIKASKKIYFPKGNYKITETIQLEPGTQIFGTRNSSISAVSIITHDNPEDNTFFSHISVNGPISWGCGKGIMAFASGQIKFTSNGGGQFYAMRSIGGRGGAALIEGNGQPVSLYTLNIERRTTNPQSFVKNVKGLRIYYFKAEATPYGWSVDGGPDTGNTPLAIIDSEDVKLYCACGNVLTSKQRPFIDVVNSRDVLISQVKSFKTDDFPQVRETFGTTTTEIASNKIAALYLRD